MQLLHFTVAAASLLAAADAFQLAPSSFTPKTTPALVTCRPARAAATGLTMMADGDNLFKSIWDSAMLKIVEVKEKDGTRKKLQKCVFCEAGVVACDACKGSGVDRALGSGDCYICKGKGRRQCEICAGAGMVDRVRRGGTDTDGKWVGSDKVMEAMSPQFEPYVLELDAGERYVWCQCGVSTKQPFCDTVSHRAYGIKPKPFKAEGEPGTKTKASLCGCKYTNTKPYCDGTHVGLKAEFDAQQKKDGRNQK